MVTKQQLDDSLAEMRTSLTNELKPVIKDIVDQAILALRENVIDKLSEDNDKLKDKVVALEAKVRSLTIEVVDGQQYTRQNNIVISGIPAEVAHEDLTKVSMNIMNHCLVDEKANATKKPNANKNPMVGFGVNFPDFEACHRISTRSTDVVCRLVNRRAVEDTLRNWKKLQKFDHKKLGLPASTTELYVNPHLSPYRSKIAYHCRQLKKNKRIKKLSTHKGNVKILLNPENVDDADEEDRWKKIVHLDELHEMFGIDVDE